jgi:hypothetical protein
MTSGVSVRSVREVVQLNDVPMKSNIERDPHLSQKKGRKKRIVFLATASLLVAIVVLTGLFFSGVLVNQNPGCMTYNFQHGTLVNTNQTFVAEWEWPFNLTRGTLVNMTLILRGGQNASAILGPVDCKLNLVQPYLYSTNLTRSDASKSWTGTIQSSGMYKLELGNLGSTNVTLQVYIHTS